MKFLRKKKKILNKLSIYNRQCFYRQICFHSRYHRKFLCMWRAYYHFCTKTKLLFILNGSLFIKYLYLSFDIFRIIVLFDIKFFPNSSSNIFYKVSIKTFTYCFCKFLTFKELKIFFKFS